VKGFLISDIHFGTHEMDLEKWLDIQLSYFKDFFIPILKKQYKKGDKVFILGDLFDNRTYINIKVLVRVLELFDIFEEMNIDIHILTGNHDLWGEKEYRYNSLMSLKKYSNVSIYTEPTVLESDDKKILMLPWVTDLKEEHKILKSYAGKVDYLFTHSDLRGAKTNLKVTLKHGPTIADFVGFPQVYAGHIHLYQKMENFTFLGSPYHLDRNDKGNSKGLTILDIATGKEKWIKNEVSPEYKTITIKSEEDVEHLDRLIKIDSVTEEKDNFIDIHINNSIIINKPEIRKKIEQVSKRKRITIKQLDDIQIEDTVEDIDLDDIGEEISVEDMIRQYVKNQQYDNETKNRIENLLEEVIKISKNNG
jgi:DNA repair exonuclease SbcCD nuclease subunit